MLVLSRQRDQVIMIGDDIQVVVVDIRGDKVRLGITAPKSIGVHRKEVYDQIKRENEAAAAMQEADLPATTPGHESPGQTKQAGDKDRLPSQAPPR